MPRKAKTPVKSPVTAPVIQTIYRVDPNLAGPPRMQLDPQVCVTPEFRAEMNAWMIDFFGHRDEAVVRNHDNCVEIHTTLRQLKRWGVKHDQDI